MAERTGISWTSATWNPVTGCDKVSPGCKNCYAERFAERWRGIKGHPYEQGFDVKLWPERLNIPLGWRKPRHVFVNSMSDLFHEKIPAEFIADVFRTMSCATLECGKRHEHELECWTGEPHTFQILTKRPERALRFFNEELPKEIETWPGDDPLCVAMDVAWPLPNVWLGVSVENEDYLHRVDTLREIPAKVRFISYEPALGPIAHKVNLEGIHWVIVGGESGPGYRPMDLQWARDIRDKCRKEGVAFFFKQSAAPRNETGIELDGEVIHEFPHIGG